MEGWGKEAGPEESEGEDRNSLWLAWARTKRLCLDGGSGFSPLIEPLWPSSTGSVRRERTLSFQCCFMEHPPQKPLLGSCCFSNSGGFLPHSIVELLSFPPHLLAFSVKKKSVQRGVFLILKNICIENFEVAIRSTILYPSRWGS